MNARTTPTETCRKDGLMLSLPMIANETIYKGSTVLVNTNGLAFTNDGTTNTLSAGDMFAGIAVETSTSNGTAGTTEVRVERTGLHLLTFSDTLTQANVGDKVYINNTSDDAVVTVTLDGGGVDVQVGVIAQFVSASTAYVLIDNNAFVSIAA